ncbi:class I SAM-dependent methyltransferase [Thauera sp.]
MKRSRPENDSYDAHARSCAPDDLWGQVKRTLGGAPLESDQIQLILDCTAAALELSEDDVLLDLCCGNGALSTHWFARCTDGVGVDASPYLIEIARSRFAADSQERFQLSEVLDYVLSSTLRSDFTKAVCYGSLQYLSPERAGAVLSALRSNCPRLSRVFIGNIPDRDRAAAFFGANMPSPDTLDTPRSAIGVWHTQRDFIALARNSGWDCRTRVMPPEFYAAHYRFDAILTPQAGDVL